MKDKLFRECIGIVNQLFDLAEVSVDKRQSINDVAYEYLHKEIRRILLENDNSLIHSSFNAQIQYSSADPKCPLCCGRGYYTIGDFSGTSVSTNKCPCVDRVESLR